MYFFLPPTYSFNVGSQADAISLVIFLTLGLVIVGFGTAHHAERQRAAIRERELRAANQKLLDDNIKLDQKLQRKNEDLQEIRLWIADESV
jgi:K+-sensing histidine kinase KdpD